MLSRRILARRGLTLVFVLELAGCGAETRPPPASAGSPPHGNRTALGGATTSLGDSALGPAAADANRSEDWPRAESLYRELGRRQPRNADAKRGLGVALLRQQKNQEAVAALEDSLRLADDPRTRLDLASAFAALDRYPSALPHLRKAVQLAPREPAAWTQLAVALVKVDKPDSASDVLNDARKSCQACASDDAFNRVTDDVARAFAAKAAQQIGSGDAPGARKSIDLALALRPNLPETHLASGKVARAEGDKKGAATAYRKAVEALPDAKADPGAVARLELATLLMSEGNGGEAVRLAEQVIAARGDDGLALDTLGRACDATRNTECARKAYGKLVALPARDAPSPGALEHARHRMKELKTRHR
jgi:Flp pilus assembly protein TadD